MAKTTVKGWKKKTEKGTAADTKPSREGAGERTKVIRNSEGFQYLSERCFLLPGGQFTNGKGLCPFGGFAIDPDRPSTLYNVTAEHCGQVGDPVYLQDSQGQDVLVGEFVASTGDALDDGEDWAVIELFYGADDYQPTVENVEIAGWVPDEELREGNMVCSLGYRSGVTCGEFVEPIGDHSFLAIGIRDHGDSGGPVWAVDPNDGSMWAVGVTSWGRVDDAIGSRYASIQPAMDKYGLKLVTRAG